MKIPPIILDNMKEIFFRPEGSYVGDVIPFYEKGVFYLYFLNDRRPSSLTADRTDWSLVTTKDFVNYEYYGTVLPNGVMDEADNSCYTGSVYKNGEEDYHIFYTAQNSYHDAYQINGHPVQTIRHAVSTDLIHWTKCPESFAGDGEVYDLFDWRDPFVFFNEKENCYNMLVTARKKAGSFRKGGCILRCRSKDLVHWEKGEPFYEPDRYYAHECPDFFELNGWWYLVYSTFTERFATHYRVSRSPEGPWTGRTADTWDARCCYAIKTAGGSEKRYAFGWIPTRKGKKDSGEYQWGGNLCVHELVQQEDGTLYAALPESIRRAFERCERPACTEFTGCAEKEDEGYILHAGEKMAGAIFEDLPEECLIEAEIEYDSGVQAFGLEMNVGEDRDDGYFFRFEPFYQRLVFDRWPRAPLSDDCQQQHYLGGDIPFQVELERPIALAGKKNVHLYLLVKNSIMVCYANKETALSVRVYDLIQNRRWGIFADGGELRIHRLALFTAGEN